MFITVTIFQIMQYSSYLMISAVLLFITWNYYKQEKTNKSMSFFILSMAFTLGIIFYILSQHYVFSNRGVERSIFNLIETGLRMFFIT
mgnify:FL=1